ncbi:MAG: glucose-1-phosphate thymidylyltransferase [Nanohaloarchaea archaeon SW_4_43_9]|nr:MAG: glucose-1-phosphate thymidylyltransferase [Nanohaloarchaea archaeon SW_4_43_9]
MKAVVLAGGHATRLWPITKDRAKPLLPLGKKPIIEYILEDLEDLEEVIISTNDKFAEDFQDYIDEYNRENVRVAVESQQSEEEKPGTIGAIINLLDEEDIDDDLLVIGGDNYYSFNTSDFLDFCRRKEGPVNVVYDVKDLDLATGFGIVDTDGDKIKDFVEKPDQPPSTLASTACYYFPRKDIELFHKYEKHFRDTDVPADKYLDEPGRLIEWAHEKTDMFTYSFDGDWYDIGTVQGYVEAMSSVVDGNIIKGDTENSDIGENVFVMEGSTLKNTTVENSIIFANTEVNDSEIRNSIIDKFCEIEDTDMKNALVGEHTTL